MINRNGNKARSGDAGTLGPMSYFRITYDGPALESSEMDVRASNPVSRTLTGSPRS